MHRLAAVCLLLLSIGAEPGLSQDAVSSFDPSLASDLDQILEEERQKWSVPGVSAAAVVDGQGLWIGVAGTDGPQSTEPITPDMLFGIASITKTVTATTILLLAEEGRLDLDDRLGDWVPPLRHVDPNITIRQLLNHTSGINNHSNHFAFFDSLGADLDRTWQPAEIFDRFVGLPFWAPGTGYRYSNSGYLILGLVIEAAVGRVATAFRDRIWTPNSLNAIYLSTEEEPMGRLATGWTDLNGDGRLDDASDWYAPALQSASWTGGAIFSTSEDLVRFGKALFGGQVLSPASMTDMLAFVDDGGNGYGLGVIRYRPFGVDFFGHAGDTIGYSSFMVCSDQRGICVAALVNQSSRPVQDFVFALIERILAFQATVSSTESVDVIPVSLELDQNYPNPASGWTSVRFSLSESGPVRVTLFDGLGRVVAVFDEHVEAAGRHEIRLSVSDLPIGSYWYRLEAAGSGRSRILTVAR